MKRTHSLENMRALCILFLAGFIPQPLDLEIPSPV